MNYPKKGDIVWCALNPIKGHEQSGSRPCIVVSGTLFNKKTGMAVICPITSTEKKNYFFRVKIETKKIRGFVMVDQLRTIDWKERVLSIDGSSGSHILREIYAKLSVLFDLT
ncbi:MAG: type II toxin-antitoxin system PemK/MazF family toxin [Candidatus Taylorbacteria bacterium]